MSFWVERDERVQRPSRRCSKPEMALITVFCNKRTPRRRIPHGWWARSCLSVQKEVGREGFPSANSPLRLEGEGFVGKGLNSQSTVITSATFFICAYSVNQHKSSHFMLKCFSSEVCFGTF